VICPASEVPDIAGTQFRSPRFIRLHHHIVKPDRKQRDLPTLSFFLESFCYLICHPIAFDRMLGQDQQQPVSQSNSGINLVEYFPTNRHVVWRKPTAYPSILQTGVDTVVGPAEDALGLQVNVSSWVRADLVILAAKKAVDDISTEMSRGLDLMAAVKKVMEAY
jgi:hypothetical protein